MSSLERNYEKELPVHIDTSEQCSRYKLEATKSLLRLHLLHSCNIHSYTSNVNRTLLQLQTQLYKIRKWQLSSYMQIEFDTLFQIITQSLIAWWQSHFYQTLNFIWCAKRSGSDFTALLCILFYLSNIWFLHPDNPAFHFVFQHPTFQHSFSLLLKK